LARWSSSTYSLSQAEESIPCWLDWRVQGLAYAGLVLVVLVFGNVQGDVPFIYFQF